MAEVAGWAEAPARAIGRFDVRKPPKSLDEMWACATNEKERQAIRTALFGSVMDVVDQFLPDRERHAQVRSMLAFLSVNSTYRGPYSAGSALCLAFALASPTGATMAKVRGRHRHPLRPPPRAVRAARRRTPSPREGGGDRGGRRDGSRGWISATARSSVRQSWCPISTRPPPSPSSSTRDDLPEAFPRRVDAIDHRAVYFQMHFALGGLPEYVGPYEVLNDGDLRQNVTFFGTAEQMQLDFEGCRGGLVPRSPSCNLAIATLRDPESGPGGKTRRQHVRLLRPHRR